MSFAYLMCTSVSGPKALKNRVCDLPYSISGKNTEHFRNRIKKIWSIRTKIALIEKLFRKNIFADIFCCLYVNLLTVKVWGQSDKFPMSFSFSQCPLQVKKLIWENRAKYVNQTGNFYLRPKLKTTISLPIFKSLFQWFLFYIRCHLSHYPFNPKNRNLKKIIDLKVYCNLKTNLVCGIKLILSINGFRTLIRGY